MSHVWKWKIWKSCAENENCGVSILGLARRSTARQISFGKCWLNITINRRTDTGKLRDRKREWAQLDHYHWVQRCLQGVIDEQETQYCYIRGKARNWTRLRRVCVAAQEHMCHCFCKFLVIFYFVYVATAYCD